MFPDSNETYRVHHSFQLLSSRLAQFEEVWSTPFETPTINVKKQYTELLNHLLGDLSLFFKISVNNTLDLIDEMRKEEIFTKESASLLQEAVAFVYVMRVGLHVQYEEQKEEIELEAIPEEDRKKLEKIYWLVLRPLYRKLKKCLNEPPFLQSYFQKADLLKWALNDEVLDPQKPETIEQVKPIVAHLAEHLALKTIYRPHKSELAHREWHRPYYGYLSSILAAEPLREVYIDTLMRFKQHTEIANLISYLANIPNRNGVRQAQRLEKLELCESILAMTTPDPEGENPVFVRFSGAPEGRYLRQEVIDQIIEQDGFLKRKYQGSAHEVAFASYQNFHLHFKQNPSHALMEYAVYALLGRFNAHLATPIELARFEAQGETYPVLISKTVDGRTLGENDRLESTSFTWGCLMAILTNPGDGRFSNNVRENNTDRLVLIDSEISFLPPVTCESKKYKIHFTSALFCLHPQPLNRTVLEQFIDLDPDLIVQSWMEELIAVDRLYQDLHLFCIPEETTLYEKRMQRSALKGLCFCAVESPPHFWYSFTIYKMVCVKL